ncbi:Protein of unknown function DUF262 [Bernardetia litoralis DSM 6794]|uniref:GmrSD restriction endonucleases N-terminal domain-containing protein n=1 Tax=Bernardetia litoralis (strain ATCC 23117 / DSM 6794 / NBRC 15988 / NCIMB 1366 / Fx l1 / Sio-4) TaxID=880071 RepID=I4AH48_BERLS|nr:DUF262 domain-containing protein [Bernardetia litoralis]AFM03283.1 Protein of unknown function DUF262 [Bernardetia litoralis DSM 6794]
MEAIQRDEIEKEIREKQKTVDYDTKEFTIELLLSKYTKDKETDENEIYVPYYQRAFVWNLERQSKFIESVILGLPIPYIFTAEMEDGRLEIVDGSQRIRTLEAFIENKFKLIKLEVLENMNGCYFDDLPVPRKRKFLNTTLRMIVLSEKSNDDARFMVFERINTGSDLLRDMEKRLGSYQGEFTEFMVEYTKNPLFIELTGFTKKASDRKEPEELILRFFAYSDDYLDFKGNVNDFLDKYLKKQNLDGFDEEIYKQRFNNVLEFVKKYFPNGLTKTLNSKKTPRLRFEAITVGVYLALKQNPNLEPTNMDWLESDEFEQEIKGQASNSPKRVKSRIEFVRDRLLSN